MGVQAASESALVVAFHDLVLDVGFIFVVQVVEDHGGEQTCDTGADDADFKGIGTSHIPRWTQKTVDDRDKFIAILWCWLRERERGPTCQLLGESVTNDGMPL